MLWLSLCYRSNSGFRPFLAEKIGNMKTYKCKYCSSGGRGGHLLSLVGGSIPGCYVCILSVLGQDTNAMLLSEESIRV